MPCRTSARRGSSMNRRQLTVLVVTLLFVAGGTRAFAGNDFSSGNVISPNKYRAAGKTLSTIEQQQLAIYRDQLEVQQRAQQLKLNQGSSRPVPPLNASPLPANPAILSRNQFETQSELDRINGLLQSAHAAPLVTPLPPSGSSGIRPLGYHP